MRAVVRPRGGVLHGKARVSERGEALGLPAWLPGVSPDPGLSVSDRTLFPSPAHSSDSRTVRSHPL